MRGKRFCMVALGLALVLALVLALAAGPSSLSASPRADFDGDGYADLAIGVPYEGVGSVELAGAVHILYGSDSSGLTATGDQLWHQDVSGVINVAEDLDQFGSALAVGDFDGDGYVDLAVGVKNQDVGTVTEAGAVHILYGASGGLTATGDQMWTQDSSGIEDTAEDHEWFGRALAVGDFDGDGYDDLAIGVAYEDVGSVEEAGAVNVLYGSASGLTATGDQLWHQDTSGINGTVEAGDHFGYSLAAADFDGDGYADLAIGVAHEDVGSVAHAGAVNVIYGSDSSGLTATGNQFWHQDVSGVADVVETLDFFGSALTVGDFDHDGYADLVIGAPGEGYGGKDGVGAVNVVFGSSGGLNATGNEFWHQDVIGTQNAAEVGDWFGHALTAGDFDGDGYDDLAVGIPYEDDGSTLDTGAVHVFYGADGGLTTAGDWWFHQNTSGILDTTEESDHFGLALTAGDFDGDGYTDLAIGVPYKDVGTIKNAGAVNVVYGSDSSGLTATGNQFWHQDVSGVIDVAEDLDQFGYVLAAIPTTRHKVYLPIVLKNH